MCIYAHISNHFLLLVFVAAVLQAEYNKQTINKQIARHIKQTHINNT